MTEKPGVTIIQDENAPVSTEVLADAIVRLSKAAEVLTAPGNLTRRALVLLLKDAAGVPGYAIERVLNALPLLAKQYTTPRPITTTNPPPRKPTTTR